MSGRRLIFDGRRQRSPHQHTAATNVTHPYPDSQPHFGDAFRHSAHSEPWLTFVREGNGQQTNESGSSRSPLQRSCRLYDGELGRAPANALSVLVDQFNDYLQLHGFDQVRVEACLGSTDPIGIVAIPGDRNEPKLLSARTPA